MRNRLLTGGVALAGSIIMASLALETVAGQAPARPATATAGYVMPRTPDGHPDLQGTYDIATITPIERPAQYGGRLLLTDEEAAVLERGETARVARGALPSRGDREAPRVGGNVGGYNNFWIDRGDQVITVDGRKRSSLIVDPADGRIPPLTPAALKRNADRRGPNPDANEATAGEAPGAFDNPEQRPLGERCLLGFSSTSGPPTLPNYFYNNLKQIVQTPGYVMILNEMVHDARVIRIGGQHLPPHIHKWNGDSIGRWEGDTLVVDTTNFTDKTRFRGSAERLHVVERFTRVDANTLLYRFTIDDPTTFTKPWTGEFPWPATNQPIYEYACHEGNYALGGILRGARLLEAEAAAKGQGNR